MPTRSKIHQPSFAASMRKNAVAREAERQRVKDLDRPTAEQRGYDGEWRIARAAFLDEHPWCSVPGCGLPATDVDHIESIRSAPHRRLDPSNFRGFCHPHHSARTARDQGFAAQRKATPGHQRGAVHPEWLRTSLIPVAVVCGPPAAGQSAYVAQRAGPSDLVLDLDEIMAWQSGLPIYSEASRGWLHPALRWRNDQLGRLHHPSAWSACWLIVGEPKPEWRAWWLAKLGPLARIVLLATPEAECIARIDADARRAEVAALHRQAVVTWWSRYQPSPFDRPAPAQPSPLDAKTSPDG